MFGLSHLFYPGGFLVQIFAEVLPDLGLLRGVFQGFGRRSRIQKVETDILDNPSPANYEELGELYKDQKQYEKAREAFTNAIAARSDSGFGAGGYSRPEIRLLPGGGIIGGCVCANGAIGACGRAFCRSYASFN